MDREPVLIASKAVKCARQGCFETAQWAIETTPNVVSLLCPEHARQTRQEQLATEHRPAAGPGGQQHVDVAPGSELPGA